MSFSPSSSIPIGPNTRTISTERLRAVVAVHLFLLRGDSILLLRRANTGYEDGSYSVPAGHIEANEAPLAAMIRETSEEIGIALEPSLLSFALVLQRRAAAPRVDFFFAATEWDGEPTNREPRKCDELRWVALDRLPANMVPYVRTAIETFRAGERYVEMASE